MIVDPSIMLIVTMVGLRLAWRWLLDQWIMVVLVRIAMSDDWRCWVMVHMDTSRTGCVPIVSSGDIDVCDTSFITTAGLVGLLH